MAMDANRKRALIEVQISFTTPMHLTYEEFADLANCVTYLSENPIAHEIRFGCVYVKLKEKP